MNDPRTVGACLPITALTLIVGLTCCCPQNTSNSEAASNASGTTPPSAATSEAPGSVHGSFTRGLPLTPPPLDASAPVNYPGLHNVVSYATDILAGGAPEGKSGFESLKALGVRTIISVDGMLPDVASARVYGLRYVHLPIQYGGMDEDRKRQIVAAVADLPRPLYIHCHHGRHRAACAAATSCVVLGLLDHEQALARMHVSGTSPNYPGLFKVVEESEPVPLRDIVYWPENFPEQYHTTGLVQAMVAIETAHDQLSAVQKAGWQIPADNPDLVPVNLAAQLVDHFRSVRNDAIVKSEPQEFHDWLQQAGERAQALEDALDVPVSQQDPAELTATFTLLTQSCTQCHTKYRNDDLIR